MNSNPKDYRPNVGMMIINQKKEIFVGKRIDHPSNFWQMPQGGIDAQEIPSIAALREMDEEVGIKKIRLTFLLKAKTGITILFLRILRKLYGRVNIKASVKSGFYINLREQIRISIFILSIRSFQIINGLQKIS